ncbi:uncharacterized protein LOC123381506 [Felis catus]|uniref:uncharacterized protein LOC123381506 n=1 Tax=Felis catus TaxID=9685 RepID=UPI001D19F985|nr:uncharacterized protein LOC123381506 [Felis catus]
MGFREHSQPIIIKTTLPVVLIGLENKSATSLCSRRRRTETSRLAACYLASATALAFCTPRPLKDPSPHSLGLESLGAPFAETKHKTNRKQLGGEPLRTWLPAAAWCRGSCEPVGPPPSGPPHRRGRHRPFPAPQRAHLCPQCGTSDRPAPAAPQASAAFASTHGPLLPASAGLCLLEGSRSSTLPRGVRQQIPPSRSHFCVALVQHPGDCHWCPDRQAPFLRNQDLPLGAKSIAGVREQKENPEEDFANTSSQNDEPAES